MWLLNVFKDFLTTTGDDVKTLNRLTFVPRCQFHMLVCEKGTGTNKRYILDVKVLQLFASTFMSNRTLILANTQLFFYT